MDQARGDGAGRRLRAGGEVAVSPAAKRAYAGLIALDLPGEDGVTTVWQAAARTAASLARAFQSGRCADLVLPRPPSARALAGLGAALAAAWARRSSAAFA